MAEKAQHSLEDSADRTISASRQARATLGIEDVMARLSLSRSRVYRLVKDGVLKASKNDALLEFLEDDVAAANAELAGRRERAEALVRLFTGRLAENGIVDLPEVCVEDEESVSKEIVSRLLLDCLAAQASDFYVSLADCGGRLFVRTLGRIHEIARVDRELGDGLKAELRARASLPDDGAGMPSEAIFRCADEGYSAQVRLSILPALAGEHVHLQFSHAGAEQTLAAIGYASRQSETLQRLLAGRPGLFILAGSHDRVMQEQRLALASYLGTLGKLVVSIDQSLNYQSDDIVQLDGRQPDETDGAVPWQLAMRLCPDAIMLDRIEDGAQVGDLVAALAAGITVLAQVRSATGVAAVNALSELGLARRELATYFRASSEFVVIAGVCPGCRESRAIEADEANLLHVAATAQLSIATGCDHCEGGFLGNRPAWGLLVEEDLKTTDSADEESSQIESASELYASDISLASALRSAALAGDATFEHIRPYLR